MMILLNIEQVDASLRVFFECFAISYVLDAWSPAKNDCSWEPGASPYKCPHKEKRPLTCRKRPP